MVSAYPSARTGSAVDLSPVFALLIFACICILLLCLSLSGKLDIGDIYRAAAAFIKKRMKKK